MSQSVSQSVIQSVSQPVSQSVSQSVNSHLVSRSVSQSVIQSVIKEFDALISQEKKGEKSHVLVFFLSIIKYYFFVQEGEGEAHQGQECQGTRGLTISSQPSPDTGQWTGKHLQPLSVHQFHFVHMLA